MPIDETHPIISLPKSNVPLWRYMDIPSFLSLITSESLTFVRADLFEDKYEGTLPNLTANLIDTLTRKQISDGKLNKGYWNFSEMLNKDNKSIYLNCWCKESHEMVHMWKIYSKENGVAIETDYQRLKDALETKEIIYPTEVNYVDFKNDFIDWQLNAMTAYTIKRKEYKSESEFRLLLPYPRLVEDQFVKLKNEGGTTPDRTVLYSNTPVIKCKVNLNTLIKRIRISPYAPKWYYDIVVSISNKYNLIVEEITQSDL